MSESNPPEDRAFLEEVSKTYTRASRQDEAIRSLIVRTFAPYLDKTARGLQLGYAEGVDTAMLAPLVRELDVVEACAPFLEEGQEHNLPNVRFHDALFEEFALGPDDAPYHYVFAVYVLEHVADVARVLAMARSVLRPDGLLFVVVPNARALSRQLARHMGLLEDLYGLTERDRQHGHRRVYDRVALNRDIEEAGFRIRAQGGIMLKILADFQLDRLLGEGVLEGAHLDGLYRLGMEYPDLCGSLFAICDPA